MQKNKKIKNTILLVVSLLLAVFFSSMLYIEYDASLFNHNKVTISTWLPLIFSLLFLGGMLKNKLNNRKFMDLIIFWPLVHLSLLLFSLCLVQISAKFIVIFICLITPPTNFCGEVISLGFSVVSLVKYRKGYSKYYLVGVMIFCLINLCIMIFSIDEISHVYKATIGL